MCIERCLLKEDEREGGTVRDHCPVFIDKNAGISDRSEAREG